MDDAASTCRSCEREIDEALTWCPFCGAEQRPPGPAEADGGEAAGERPRGPSRAVPPFAWVALAAAVAAAAVAVWFFVLRDDDRGPVSLLEVGPGDCWVDRDEEASEEGITEVLEVPCDEPHSLEVFALFDLPGGTGAAYPDRAALDAERGCRERLEGYTGVPYAASPLDVWPLYPTPTSWTAGDREVVCSLYAMTGTDLTGSQRDAGGRLTVSAIESDDLDTCEAVTPRAVSVAQLFIDAVDAEIGRGGAFDPDDLADDLLAASKSELLLLGRAEELGCDAGSLNAGFAPLVGSLTAGTAAGEQVIDDYAANGYFATG